MANPTGKPTTGTSSEPLRRDDRSNAALLARSSLTVCQFVKNREGNGGMTGVRGMVSIVKMYWEVELYCMGGGIVL